MYHLMKMMPLEVHDEEITRHRVASERKVNVLTYLVENLPVQSWWASKYYFCEMLAYVNLLGNLEKVLAYCFQNNVKIVF